MIDLITQRFYYPDYSYSGTAYANFLYGAVGDRVRAETVFEIHWEAEDVNMTFVLADLTIERNDGGIGSFWDDGFKIGDTITIVGTASNNSSTTITAISDDGTIMTVAALLANETSVTCTIHGTTPIPAIDFFPNLCENDVTDFFDLTDRFTSPRYYVTSMSAGVATNMSVGSNSIGWITGNDGVTNGATIIQNSFSNYRRRFTVSHTFLITPIYLVGELATLQNRLPPSGTNLRDRRALKYVCEIFGKYTNYDPVIPQTAQFTSIRGNTGWFNEFINGNQTVYQFESIRYLDSASQALEAIEYCDTTSVQIKITSNSVFTLAERKFILNFMWLPNDESFYVDKRTDWTKNFIFERCVMQAGVPGGAAGATVQGGNAGDYHFLTNANVQLINTSHATINFTVDFSTYLETFFTTQDEENLNYLLWVTTEQSLLTTPLTGDRTAIICDVNELDCDRTDTTLFEVITLGFYNESACEGLGFTDIKAFPKDTILAKGDFYLGGQAKEINITVRAQDSDNNIIELEKYAIDASQFRVICDSPSELQPLEINESKDYNLPFASCRNTVQFYRSPNLDTATRSGFALIYPLRIRWEEWQTVFPANDCFPSPTQNWAAYQAQGWSLYFVIEASVEKDGYTTEFEHMTPITILDVCDLNIYGEIKTYEETQTTEVDDLILLDEDTIIKVTYTGDFSAYSESQLFGVISLDVYGEGGEKYLHTITTEDDNDDDMVLQGVTAGTYTATLTKVSNTTVTVTARVKDDYLEIRTDQYVISSKISVRQIDQSSSGGVCPTEIFNLNFSCGELQIIEVVDADTLIVMGYAQTTEERLIPVQEMRITRTSANNWTIENNGLFNGFTILSGTMTMTGTEPATPYADTLVDEIMQGNITGNLFNSNLEINGIGSMQIGCSFFVS